MKPIQCFCLIFLLIYGGVMIHVYWLSRNHTFISPHLNNRWSNGSLFFKVHSTSKFRSSPFFFLFPAVLTCDGHRFEGEGLLIGEQQGLTLCGAVHLHFVSIWRTKSVISQRQRSVVPSTLITCCKPSINVSYHPVDNWEQTSQELLSEVLLWRSFRRRHSSGNLQGHSKNKRISSLLFLS